MKLLNLSLLLVGMFVCHAAYAMEQTALLVHKQSEELTNAKNIIDNADQRLKALNTVMVTNYPEGVGSGMMIRQVQEQMMLVDKWQKVAQGIINNRALPGTLRLEAVQVNQKAIQLQHAYGGHNKK